MRQIIHLLVVDSERRAALAARIGSRWLLPVLSCAERVRVPPLAARWCEGRGIRADVAGQWLGRVTEQGTDWLMVVATRANRQVCDAGLAWTSFDALTSNESVVEYQQWALGCVLDRVRPPSVSGSFGNLTWPDRARAWITAVAGAPFAVTPYRVGAHEVVLGADCTAGRVYFKGLVGERAAEAHLTQALAALAPDSFAQTLALERQADGSTWWLTAACPGETSKDADASARALAGVQQRVNDAVVQLTLTAVESDLAAAADWTRDLLVCPASASVIRDACDSVIDADVPRSWIPMDLDPTNILVDDIGAVRFIDVDDSFAGPAPLAIAAFAQRCRHTTAYRSYEASWSPSLKAPEWQRFAVAAAVLQAWLGWQRLTQHVERGEVCATLDRVEARIRERLGRTIYGCR
jgi:hypothetical protein